MTTSSKRLGAATLGALVLLGTGGAVAARAAGSARHTTTKESFLVTYGPGEHEVVVAHGVITGGGKDIAHDSFDVLHLGGGTLRLNHPDAKAKYQQHLNPATCYASFTITGPYTIDHGTGQYAGDTGSGTYHVTGAALAQRTKSGGCNQQSEPKVEAAFIRASGTLAK